MRFKRGFLFLLLTIFLFSLASASLGVSPGLYEVNFEPGLKQVFHFEFFGDDPNTALEVYAEGDLAKYVELSTKSLTGGGVVNVLLQLPNELEVPGTHKLYIGAIPSSVSSQGVGIVANVRGTILVHVPFPGQYATMEFSTGNANTGQPVKFYVKVNNLGKEDIIASVLVDIYDSRKNKIETFPLGQKPILSTTSEEFIRELDTSSYRAGDYLAKAVVNYADKVLESEKEFRLGELYVDITNYTRELERGKINRFSIEVESFWNDPIENLFGSVNIMGTNINFLTPSIRLEPWSKSELEGFFDTTEIADDKIEANVTLHYQGKVTEKIVDLRLKRGINYLIIGIVMAIVFVLIVLVIWSKRKGKKLKRHK